MSKSKKTLAPSSIVTSRDPKGLKFTSIPAMSYDKARLSEEEAQRLNDTPGLADLIDGFIAKNRRLNQYANEEVGSGYGYPKGFKPKDPMSQSNDLRQLIGGIGFFDQDYLTLVQNGTVALPDGAEGWFAIPRWQKIAPTYNEAVEKVLALIASKRTFKNWREGQLGPDRFRQHPRTAHALDVIAEQQKGADILIIPAQFGQRHAGRSVRRAREVFTSPEFGLDAFSNAVMLLTHPERLIACEDLWIDCAGDEYAPAADGRFNEAPYFDFYVGCLGLDAHVVGSALDFCGSASGFVPQAV